MNSFGGMRDQDLALHPTVKPVAMIADAIKDVSKRNDIVLDLFGGSGSTLIAAHKTGRRAYLCELDPLYCDRLIRRWQTYAKDDAVLKSTGQHFENVEQERRKAAEQSGRRDEEVLPPSHRTPDAPDASEKLNGPRTRSLGVALTAFSLDHEGNNRWDGWHD